MDTGLELDTMAWVRLKPHLSTSYCRKSVGSELRADLTADRFGHFQAVGALLPALTYYIRSSSSRLLQTGLDQLQSLHYIVLTVLSFSTRTMLVCLPWSDKAHIQ